MYFSLKSFKNRAAPLVKILKREVFTKMRRKTKEAKYCTIDMVYSLRKNEHILENLLIYTFNNRKGKRRMDASIHTTHIYIQKLEESEDLICLPRNTYMKLLTLLSLTSYFLLI